MTIQQSTLACATLAASMSVAYAGPCSPEITRVYQEMIDGIQAKAGAATAPESTAAKTHHQPTPSSIAAAKVELGRTSLEQFTAVKEGPMARALEADSSGDRSACEQALAEVKRLQGSAGTQTNAPH
jgi:hypothetical protein